MVAWFQSATHYVADDGRRHAKKEEAVAKLNAGVKFDEVAREFSEDKARQGMSLSIK